MRRLRPIRRSARLPVYVAGKRTSSTAGCPTRTAADEQHAAQADEQAREAPGDHVAHAPVDMLTHHVGVVDHQEREDEDDRQEDTVERLGHEDHL